MRTDFDHYRASGENSSRLVMLEDALLSIPPTSVEAERAFSAAALFATKMIGQAYLIVLWMTCAIQKHIYLVNSSKNESSGALSDMLDLILVNSNKNESSGSRESICFISDFLPHLSHIHSLSTTCAVLPAAWTLYCIVDTLNQWLFHIKNEVD